MINKKLIAGLTLAFLMIVVNLSVFADDGLTRQIIDAQGSTPYIIIFMIAQIIIVYVLTQVNFSKSKKRIIHIGAIIVFAGLLSFWSYSIFNSDPIPKKQETAQNSNQTLSLSNNVIEERSGAEFAVGYVQVKDRDEFDFLYDLTEVVPGKNNNDIFTIDFTSPNGNLLRASYDLPYDIKSNYTVEVRATGPDGTEIIEQMKVYIKPLLPFKENGGLNGSYFSKNLINVIVVILLMIMYLLSIVDFNKKTRDMIRLVLSYVLLLVLVVVSVYPILFIIMTSIKVENTLSGLTFLPLDEFGKWNGTMQHYKDLFVGRHSEFVTWFLNTLKISTLSMIFGTILTILASYALSRFKFRGRETSLTALLILGMFPGFMAMIAIYIFLQEMGLHDTHLALILVYSLGAPLGGVFVAKGFYDTIPKSLEEAARIDGASQMGIFVRIVLPLSKPMLTFIALTIFTGTWVDFIFAKIIIFSDSKMTLAVGLLKLAPGAMNESFYNAFAAGSVLAAIPITLLFIFLQRFLVDGLTAGASKG